jgi:hypothetical protein
MENPNHKIDEIFRQRLHDAEVPPPPFVWPAVEQAAAQTPAQVDICGCFTFGVGSRLCWTALVLANPMFGKAATCCRAKAPKRMAKVLRLAPTQYRNKRPFKSAQTLKKRL